MKIIRYSVCALFACLFATWVVWYVHMLATGKNVPRSSNVAKTNAVSAVEHIMDEDEEGDEVQKKSIDLADIDPDGKTQYPSDDELEKMITEGTKESIEQLEEFLQEIAFDEKWKEMSRAYGVLTSISDWHTNVSEEVQAAYISALKDFTPLSIPEVIPFLGSDYEDVKDTAQSEISDFIDDSEDDNLIAGLIVSISSLVEDEDFADRIVLKIDSMDSEIAAITMIGLMRNGTEVIKNSLRENMEFITDQEEMTPEAVLKWAAENKLDDEDN